MASGRLDVDGSELCMIDSGIHSLHDVPLKSQLQVLNLHSNYIQRIENLGRLHNLRHLDLSSNQITRIEGLEGLVTLRTLNLSCNLIRDVDGLSPLRSLVKMNLSYNQIEGIEGLSRMSGPQYKLSHIEVHGNKLRSLTHLKQNLSGCFNLRHLVLSQDGSGNPVCHQPGYHQELFTSLPQLRCLDGKDRAGRHADVTDVLADIPGLEEYMDYLVSTSSSEQPISDLITPKIDKALATYRQRHQDVSTTQSSTDVDQSPSSTRKSKQHPERESPKKPDQELRLRQLEDQLAALLQKHQKIEEHKSSSTSKPEIVSCQTTSSSQEKTETLETEDSDSAQRGRQSRRSGQKSKKSKKSKVPTYRKSTASSRAKSEERQTAQTSSSVEGGVPADEYHAAQPDADDLQYRDDIKSTYVHLMKELEEERERRWKAEQAAKKLADHIGSLQSRAKEDSETKTTALEATGHLKKVLMNEREAKIRLQEENEQLKDKMREMSEELSRTKENELAQKLAVKSRDDTMTKQEREHIQQQAHEMKRLQETQMKAAALSREVELLRHTSESQKGQLNQLRELLASREQEHREKLKRHYSLGSPELETMVQKEVESRTAKYQQEVILQRDKLEDLTRQYSELEDEFRMALKIEASRFSQLQVSYEKTSKENEEIHQVLSAAQRKDEKSSAMITELTSLVKEQKGRITELSKAKHEQNVDFRERVSTLEAHVEEARKRMVQLELLKKEKAQLTADVQAQSSVIDGLKAERKLWGQELAQQGASLAQDRGRLESRIEILTQDNAHLKKQLERETDGLRIKSKVIDDQTETIRKLKEGLLERGEEIKKAREEALKGQQDLEAQLLEERAANQDTQDDVDRLRERKEELKREVISLKEELEESQNAHSILSNRWKEKSSLIGQLEQQVTQMRDSWEGKEKKLTNERNKAVEAANLAIEKLRSTDDAFRKQLEAKEQTHQEDLARLEHHKQQAEEANRRVAMVEDEMRQLLRETEANKRGTEDKVKRLTQALGDLQADLF